MKESFVGTCDICGQNTGAMKLYILKLGDGIQRLCISHYHQEKRNNMPMNKTIKQNYKDRFDSGFASLIPNQRRG